jgi:hypothetical protein
MQERQRQEIAEFVAIANISTGRDWNRSDSGSPFCAEWTALNERVPPSNCVKTSSPLRRLDLVSEVTSLKFRPTWPIIQSMSSSQLSHFFRLTVRNGCQISLKCRLEASLLLPGLAKGFTSRISEAVTPGFPCVCQMVPGPSHRAVLAAWLGYCEVSELFCRGTACLAARGRVRRR